VNPLVSGGVLGVSIGIIKGLSEGVISADTSNNMNGE
jgi:hypothetical protein